MNHTIPLPDTHTRMTINAEIATRGVDMAFAKVELAIRLRPLGKVDEVLAMSIAVEKENNLKLK